MSDPQPIPPRGLVAGKYEVVRLIGRGGMGAVWEGRHATLGTRVAIKFIDQEYAESREARARFETEARAAAALQSKHAIQIYDHGVTDDGRPYMVMELLRGEPLDDRIDRLGRLPLQETARIVQQVCRALQRAHEAGIIHRDLKPENIFLVRSPDDDDEIAKVLDFGIAKIKAPADEQGVSSSTKTGAVLGTPYYMAPEQARGLRSIDHRADLWSLGIIAFKCVSGRLPFEGESVGDLLVKICTAPPPVPSQAVPGLPPAFDVWFARTMDREPANRFSSAAELAEGLALAAGVSVRRGPMSSQPHATALGPTRLASTPSGQAYTPQPVAPYSVEATSGPTPYPMSGTPHPMTPNPLAGPPLAGLTSAPFVSSAGLPSRSSRGVLLGVAVAAVLGGTIGVVTVVKLTSAGRAVAGASASNGVPAGTTTGATAPSATASVAAVAATTTPSTAASPAPLEPAAPAEPPVQGTAARPAATFAVGAAVRARPPPATTKPGPVPATTAAAAPPAIVKTPTHAQTPTSSDPGY